MEVLINVGTAIVGKLAEYTVDSVRCLFPYTSHVRSLRDRIQELRNKEKEFRVRVDAAKREGEEIVDKARTWLTTAGARSREAENFLNNECQANDRCFGGSLPNLVSRHRLSKRAKELAEDLANLIEGAGRIDRVSEPAALQGPVKNVGDYMAFASRKKILKGIMAALRDPGITKIGVCGMGGIGKTMLAYEVVRQATKEKLFSEVVITTISQNPNVHIIQQDIADKLHLSFGEVQNRHERAHRLQSHLKEAKKKILIILDDIWERLDLIEVVGIDFERDPLGCKVLLTYRDLNRVQSYMKVGKCFEVDVLRPEEERSLFNQIVGDNKLVEQPDFGPLATDIIGECGGLPLAIITVAYALKDRGLSVWKDALQQLRSSDLRGIEGMSDKVYKSIKLSYDFVKRKEEKSLLLLCSLYEEDKNIFIEELTRYCVGWGLLRNVHTLEEARTGVDSLVERLKARCLLLDGKFYGTVKMHDIIRDVAILIASEEHGMRSIMFDELEDHTKVKELHNSKAISILRCESCDNTARPHPERLECPQLELLLFMTKATHYGSKYNLNHLFVEAKELKTLSWNGTDIKSFGRSFGLLENLQTLCLRCREFEDTDLIGDLKNLRILDLSHSSVKQLTRKLGQLTRLQLLDLRGCDNLEVIEPNVISNLTRLEELYMAERFQGWEVEEEGINERRNASLMELKNLQRLTVLHLTVDNANILPRELFSRISIGTLVRYRISIGTLVGWKDYIGSPLDFISLEYEMSRSLTLKFNQSSQLIESGLELLMNGSEVLLLDGSNMGNRNVVCDLNRKGFPELKHLHFYNNDGVQFVVCSVDQIQPCRAFPSLETLKLGDLTNLERICHGKLTADSFNKLRKVYVIDCDKLKNLFPLSVVKRLHYIIVEGCEMMEEIVSRGRENHDASHEVEIFELRHLSLSFLPKFVEFCRSEMEATCGSSSIDSDSPKPIFSEQ
ncbi:LRR domain containing protein, partial [Trema orientale]